MAISRYPNRHLQTGGRRLPFFELALALSVIVGLGFVTLRVKTMVPAGWTNASASASEVATVEAKTEVPALAATQSDSKLP